jgi:hypothetical protein
MILSVDAVVAMACCRNPHQKNMTYCPVRRGSPFSNSSLEDFARNIMD